ncbi:MAG TPA: hypothetical protein VKX45_01860 [Bryobacteraceae bacterium]|jgi:hypothetical protein|nr:hypothetical protein [Bryobacteraceae bacterium]
MNEAFSFETQSAGAGRLFPLFDGLEWEGDAVCPSPAGATVSGFGRYRSSVAGLPAAERAKLAAVARAIRASAAPGCQFLGSVRLAGHADRDFQRGPDYERKISGNRAEQARLALIQAIADPAIAGRIQWDVQAAGASQLVVPSPRTEAQRAQNRRVEITVAPLAGPGPGPDVDDPRINVFARQALRRMLAGDASARSDATGMVAAVKAGQLAGIYKEDDAAAVAYARKLSADPRQVIPAGEDAAVILNGPAADGPPIIDFHDAVRQIPARLDPALRKAWTTFQAWRSCQLCGPSGVVQAEVAAGSGAGNIVPAVCQPRPRPARDPWFTADSAGNVRLFPDRVPRIVEGPLAAVQGGLVTDSSLRPRVSAIVGPGATPLGLAQSLLPLYRAAPKPGGARAPTAEELARGILIYSQFYLPLPDLRNYRDGLRIPLPIEIDQATGDWVLNSKLIRQWAGLFPAGCGDALNLRPDHLPQPDDAAVTREAQALIAAHSTPLALSIALQARMLANAFEAVFLLFAAFRAAVDPFQTALEFCNNAVNHQVNLLASLTAGAGALFLLRRILGAPPARLSPAAEAQRRRALGMIERGLGIGARLTTARDVPETAAQLVSRRGGCPSRVRASDPPGGIHRMVLGRDVLAGCMTHAIDARFEGPDFAGRLAFPDVSQDPRFAPDRANPQFLPRVAVVRAIAPNEGRLDGMNRADAAIVSAGIQQWGAHSDPELSGLLRRFKAENPDEFELYFGIYRLDVRGAGALGATLQERLVNQAAKPAGVDIVVRDLALPPSADRGAFFIEAPAGGRIVRDSAWAARFREAAIASAAFRAAQIREGAARFDRILRTVPTLNVTLNGVRRSLPTNQVITSQLGVALILDQHINAPGNLASRRGRTGDLQRAADRVGSRPDLAALDVAITANYANHRVMNDAVARASAIRRSGLSDRHGSFTGW